MYHSAAKKSSVSSFLQEIWRRRGGGCRHVPLLAEKGKRNQIHFQRNTKCGWMHNFTFCRFLHVSLLFKKSINYSNPYEHLTIMNIWALWTYDHYGHLTIMNIWPLWAPDHYGHLTIIDTWPLWTPDHYGLLTIMDTWPLKTPENYGHLTVIDTWPLWTPDHYRHLTIMDSWPL